MAILNNIGNILLVAFGLGFVIFWHELGHFALAKWNGVKVEKFSIGFGKTLLGFRRGETEYVIALVPLGGFVKMLGENPEEAATASTDPRAYPNKPVWARMAIISAGVAMNVVLGLACFVYAYGRGMEEMPAQLGGVVAGSPAYEAGIRAGDEIVGIDGRRGITYKHVMIKVIHSNTGQVLHLELKRPGQSALVAVDVVPRREASRLAPTIGILQSPGLALNDPPRLVPAGLGAAGAQEKAAATLQPGDRLVALGPVGAEPTPVTDMREVDRLWSRYRADPLTEVFERRPKAGKPESVTVTLPPNHFVTFGFQTAIEPITAIQKGSIAERAGFRPGDKIVKVDGNDFDPLQLPDLCFDHAGTPLTFEVERPTEGQTEKKTKTVTLTATPDDSPIWTDIVIEDNLVEPLEVPGLGLAYPVRPKVVTLVPDSPAAKAGLKVGDVLNTLTIAPAKPGGESLTITFSDETPQWAATFALLQLLPRQSFAVTVNGSKTPITITPEPDPSWPHPLRGQLFDRLVRMLPPQPPAAALRRGYDDTVDSILSIYAMLRSLVIGRISGKALGGPLTIAQFAYRSAGMGTTQLIHFLGLLSINLAVLNFLPIPPLDGGQMVFLVAEKVRGRPLPESALVAGTYTGLVLVLALMVYVLFQDVSRMFFGCSGLFF